MPRRLASKMILTYTCTIDELFGCPQPMNTKPDRQPGGGAEWGGNPSVFTDLFAISSSLNYFSSLGKTLSITVRLGNDKNSVLAD